MSSFTSDQTTINMATVGSNTLARTGRSRVTSIQAEGIAGSTIILYDSTSTGSPGTAVATYNYNTCLLYTSPSPRDATLSRMPSSA